LRGIGCDEDTANAVVHWPEIQKGGPSVAIAEQFEPRSAVVLPAVDEQAARRALRRQIAHLERELASAALDARPRLDPLPPLPSLAGPRLLGLGDLERVRDALAARLSELRGAAQAQERRQERSRALLDEMLADPPAHKWVRVSNEQLGEPGCKHYHVRPRLGPIGLLMSWWRVVISSGCPLASGP
jgi:hypothetical protein